MLGDVLVQMAKTNHDDEYRKTLSISIFGIARIEDGERAKRCLFDVVRDWSSRISRYRQIHLEKNRQFENFIEVFQQDSG